MRILKLTPALEKRLLAARVAHDAAAGRVAARIVADVRRGGDDALLAWSKRLDGNNLRSKDLWITRREMDDAQKRVSDDFWRAIKQAARNIRTVAKQQMPPAWTVAVEPGVQISQRVVPIESVGLYIPGGRASLVSTFLMNAIPAQVAGVRRIVAVCPKPNAEILAAARLLGVETIARIGGAQGIAALAYGTKTIPRVEKIFGPGNKYVTAAKQIVSSDCAIDMPAGPTEAIVLAERGDARWIAADLLAQAEHAADAASFLVTTSRVLAEKVAVWISRQLNTLPAENSAHTSIKRSGAILLAASTASACDFVNRFAPEHLSLPSDYAPLVKNISSCGTVFLGPWAAQPLGDYVSGSNHILPTAGWARRRGGLSTADFVKCFTVQKISGAGFRRLADAAEALADAEGLQAHRNAVGIRR